MAGNDGNKAVKARKQLNLANEDSEPVKKMSKQDQNTAVEISQRAVGKDKTKNSTPKAKRYDNDKSNKANKAKYVVDPLMSENNNAVPMRRQIEGSRSMSKECLKQNKINNLTLEIFRVVLM